ncbi:MAG TPA: O-acetyl-ADP-ribose deacetylase [Candidatus Sulfotelmatobacter sp.]|jgi:O-acetyl-ADP-ribose deacetylase|nr:O-acetyl-ADP-ribose deacetylase [Candidatus Sulfotelmatobacter sp.]
MLAYPMELRRDKDYFVRVMVSDPEEVRLVHGDITQYPSDAIVNAANSELLPGGGVCGAIHRLGGPEIAEECHRIRSGRGSLAAGQAVATTAGLLQAKFVIHAVGPVWRGGDDGEAEMLSGCYRESMRVADELKLQSIAFPAISTGIFGYPVEQAARVAIPTVIESLRSAKHLVFASIVLFDKATLNVFAAVATAQRQPVSGNPYKVAIGIMNE